MTGEAGLTVEHGKSLEAGERMDERAGRSGRKAMNERGLEGRKMVEGRITIQYNTRRDKGMENLFPHLSNLTALISLLTSLPHTSPQHMSKFPHLTSRPPPVTSIYVTPSLLISVQLYTSLYAPSYLHSRCISLSSL